MIDQKSPVLMLDPYCFSPFYNCNLSASLISHGWHVRLLTSEFPFEKIAVQDHTHIETFFFRQILTNNFVHRHNALRGVCKTISYPLEMLRFTRYLEKTVPQRGIVHIQWANIPFLDKKLWRKWKDMGWRIVFTAHDPEPLPGTTILQISAYHSTLLRHADAVLVHSHTGKKILIDQGLDSATIHEIPMGPTILTEMRPIPQKIARFRLEIPTDSPTLLFFGFIKNYKGLDVLLKALKAVCSVYANIRLLVAGRLMDSISRYQSLIEHSSLDRHVQWHLHFIASADIPLYFSAADVVVIPYRQASSSSVIDLAHYFGKPVVATATGGLPEQVRLDEGDRLIPPDSPELLAHALIAVLQETLERQSRHADTQTNGSLAMTWSNVARRHAEIYQSLHRG
jgi:D-inositol-3-phosphate glycosyltransferase